MSTGLDCRDSYVYEWEGLATMVASSDWVSHVLALPMSEEPGTRFEYCNGSSLLLSAILSEVTGVSASEFAREVLFEPLGISEFAWMTSPRGVSIGWSDLMLSPADLAKIGLLHLWDGEWDGDQLVSRGWIEAATVAHIEAGTASDRYGYQWWVDEAGYSMALGFGGQYIFVIPDQDVVVVFVSGLSGDRTAEPEELTNEYVLRAIVSDAPLAPNADDNGRLSNVIAAARTGPLPVTPLMPDTAITVDGVPYEVGRNDLGISEFEIRFVGNSAFVELGMRGVAFPLEVGLNGRFVTNDIPGEPPMALRGEWSSDDSFVIEYQSIGEIERGTWQVAFDDASVRVEMRDSISGTVYPFTGDRTN